MYSGLKENTYSILFYSILFYSILFYSILFYSILSSGVLSPYMLVMSGCLWFNKKSRSSGVTGTWYRSKLFQPEIYGIPYMKKSRNSVKFRGISRNYIYVTEFGGIPPEF